VFRSKRAKVIAVLFLIGIFSSASASVYAFFYTGMTSTIRAPDVTLAAGADSSGSCSAYPCASVSIVGTSDVAAVSISMFRADSSFNPPPASYYSNLIQINDANNPHSIVGVQIFGIIPTSSSDFGKITVYYCTVQTEFNPEGSLVTPSDCVGSYVITSTTSGSVSGSFPVSISAGSTQYLEIVAYGGSAASISDVISFNISIEWA
jgi:hypothetical protein